MSTQNTHPYVATVVESISYEGDEPEIPADVLLALIKHIRAEHLQDSALIVHLVVVSERLRERHAHLAGQLLDLACHAAEARDHEALAQTLENHAARVAGRLQGPEPAGTRNAARRPTTGGVSLRRR